MSAKKNKKMVTQWFETTTKNTSSQGMTAGEQDQSSELSIADTYNKKYASSDKMTISWKIFKEVFGDDYPPDEVAGFNFSTLSELRRIAHDMRVGPGQIFIDLACGMGGPGLWIAQETGANLVGIDFSTEAIVQAEKRAAIFGLSERAKYRLADIADTGFPASMFDGAVSIDVLQYAPDKLAVLREVGRILRPDARFVFTTWEDRRTEANFKEPSPQKLYDYRPLLCEAGFNVMSYEESKDWERRQRGIYLATLAHSDEIIQEMGRQAAESLIEEAKLLTELHDGKDILTQIRRILVVARRVK